METDDKMEAEAIQSEQAQSYPLAHLLQHSEQLFHVKQEVVHGAVYGLNKSEYTVDELAALVENFMGKVVE